MQLDSTLNIPLPRGSSTSPERRVAQEKGSDKESDHAEAGAGEVEGQAPGRHPNPFLEPLGCTPPSSGV